MVRPRAVPLWIAKAGRCWLAALPGKAMSMVTSCAYCATTFGLSQEQLKARQGKVRCGQCNEVFDAFRHWQVFRTNRCRASPRSTLSNLSSTPHRPLPCKGRWILGLVAQPIRTRTSKQARIEIAKGGG